eukprot:COSAG06_NODE_305_length_17809_cov_6.221796_11_plen_34_part_00
MDVPDGSIEVGCGFGEADDIELAVHGDDMWPAV